MLSIPTVANNSLFDSEKGTKHYNFLLTITIIEKDSSTNKNINNNAAQS